MRSITTITLSKTTKMELEKFGHKNESFDKIIQRLISQQRGYVQ